MRDLYTEKYKTLMKKRKTQKMERFFQILEKLFYLK